jgi:hypothetical protein
MERMEGLEQDLFDNPKSSDYKAMETKLYGEVLKACRFYHNKLSIISIIGILELVKQEINELEKIDMRMLENSSSHDAEALDKFA